MTLGTGIRFSPIVCQGWVYMQLIFVELLTFVVEAVLVVRRECIPIMFGDDRCLNLR